MMPLSLHLLGAEGSGCAFGEIDRHPATEAFSVYAEFKNDSYSVLPGDGMDWDDLRSFGFYTGLSLDYWRLGATVDALIYRTDAYADSRRIDELYFTLDRNLVLVSKDRLSVAVTLGTGCISLENMGTRALQQETHTLYGTQRLMPTEYAIPETPLTFIGYASGSARFGFFEIPLGMEGSIECGHTGFYRAQTLVSANPLDAEPGVTLYAGYLLAGNYESYGTAFQATVQSESGPFVGSTFHAGNLLTGYALNLRTWRPAGYCAVRYPAPKAGRATDGEISMELLALPLIAGVRLRRTFRESRFALSPCLGAESGPAGFDRIEGEHFRFSRAYLGLDTAYSVFPVIDVYALAACGFRLDQQRACHYSASRIIDEASSLVVIGEIGIRLFAPSSLVENPEWGISVSACAECYQTIRSGLYPSLRIALVTSTGRS